MSIKKESFFCFTGPFSLIVLLLFLSSSFAQEKRIICYYSDWSETRNEIYKLLPWNIDTTLCTHIVYAFGVPDISEGVLPFNFLNTLHDDNNNDFVNLKKSRPDLKLMLSVGGWQEGATAFSKIAGDDSSVAWFSAVMSDKIRRVGFDGLDINWQWPTLRQGSISSDKENLVKFVKKIKEIFDDEARKSKKATLLLSIVLPPFKSYVEEGFDVKELMRYVDFVNLHTMDYGVTNAVLSHVAPLVQLTPISDPEESVNFTVNMYIEQGIDPGMMNLGIPFYGRSFQLSDETQNDIGSLTDGEGPPGFATNIDGQLAYFEICKYLNKSWTVIRSDSKAQGPYAFYKKHWVSYDDTDIVKEKVQFAVNKQLGGITLVTIDMDDFNGICKERFPLSKAASNTLKSARQENKPKSNPLTSSGYPMYSEPEEDSISDSFDDYVYSHATVIPLNYRNRPVLFNEPTYINYLKEFLLRLYEYQKIKDEPLPEVLSTLSDSEYINYFEKFLKETPYFPPRGFNVENPSYSQETQKKKKITLSNKTPDHLVGPPPVLLTGESQIGKETNSPSMMKPLRHQTPVIQSLPTHQEYSIPNINPINPNQYADQYPRNFLIYRTPANYTHKVIRTNYNNYKYIN